MLGECIINNTDRRIEEPGIEPVDVLMLTLDADTYLEKCLDSVYREIPVNRVIVCDGGSGDSTIEILNKYPRVEIHVRPDIRTTGKCLEFLFSHATTPYVAIIDADMELGEGWYDEMLTYKDKYDYYESERIMHYEFYRENPGSVDMNQRSFALGQFGSLECLRNYHVDDDYMRGPVDMHLRQVVEKSGYRYGKVATTYHYHHATENMRYNSDEDKSGTHLVFEGPKWEILNHENWGKHCDSSRRAIVKYLDPEFVYLRNLEHTENLAIILDLEWIKKTNMKWYRVVMDYRKKLDYRKKSVIRRLQRLVIHLATLPLRLAGEIRRTFIYIMKP
jgi:glycosyltransferase involved in cell wall biosynthesis